jgi:hypothetical protein
VSMGANEITSLLVCPCDSLELSGDGRVLKCPNGHEFPMVGDVPVLLRSDVPQTIDLASASLRHAWADVEGKNADGWYVETLGISIAQRVSGKAIRVDTAPRRPADPPVLVGAADRARAVLGWQPRSSALDVQIADVWNWMQKEPAR